MSLTSRQEELLLAIQDHTVLHPDDNARTGAYRVLDALGYVMVISERRRGTRATTEPGTKVVLLTRQGEQAVAGMIRRRTATQKPGSSSSEPSLPTL